MRLNAIQIEQWRSFEMCELEFPDGIIGVRGPNGAGKSNLMEAIGWALFGKVGGQREGVSIQDLRRQDRPEKARSAVTLEFELEGVQYKVERVVSGSVKLWIDDDPEPETTQMRATNERLAQVLGIAWEQFIRTTFAQQKDIAALSGSWTAPQRRAQIERWLGLGRYSRAAELARAEVRRLKSELDGRRASAPDLNEAVAALREAEAAATAGDPEVAAAQSAAEAAKAAHDAADSAVKTEESRRAKSDLLNQHLAGLNDNLEDARPRLKRLEDAVAQRQKNIDRAAALGGAGDLAAALRAELTAWDRLEITERSLGEARTRLEGLTFDPEALAAARAAVERLTAEQELLSTAMVSRSNRIEQAAARVAALAAVAETGTVMELAVTKDAIALELREIQSREAFVRAELKHDQNHVDEVEAGGPETPCPVCRKPFGDTYDEILAGYHNRIAGNESELSTLAIRLEEASEKLAETTEAWEGARTAEQKLSGTTGSDTLEAARAEVAAAEEAASMAAARQKEISNELAQLGHGVEEHMRAEGTVTAERRHVEDCEKERTNALRAAGCDGYDGAAHADLRKRCGEASAEASELTALTALIESNQGTPEEARKLGERIAKLDIDIAAATDSVRELALDPAALGALQAAHRERQTELAAAQEALTQARITATASSEQVAAARKAHETAVAEQQEVDRQAALLRVHDVVETILTGYRDQQRMRAWPHLERSAGELLSETTDGRYADVRFSEKDCRLTIVDRGEAHVLGRYSGGEQDLANLCLRLAIAGWVSQEQGTELDFVILDEVFGSQDESRRESLIDTLNGLGARFRQVFVVTHVDDIAERCDSQVDVVLEEPGRSTATLVSARL